MTKGGWTNFGIRTSNILKKIKPRSLIKKKDNATQNEIQFQGIFIADSKIKLLWFLAFLGPVGLILPFFISNRKEYVSKDKKDYYYCDLSRMNVERITIFAFIMTIAYALVIYYYVEDVNAKELDKKYREEQIRKI